MLKDTSGKTNVFLNRNYRLVFFGALVSELGAMLYSFAVSFYILELSGNNAFLQGLYLALCGVVYVVFTPVGGVLGDRFNKAKIMYICDYVKGGVIALATLLLVLFQAREARIAVLFAAGILGNAVSGIFSPASSALPPHIVEQDQLQQANAYFSVKNSLQTILGVVLAGILYAALPVPILFAIVAACYVLSGVSEMFIRYAHDAAKERLTIRLALADMREGLDYLKGQKAIMMLMAAILFINFFFAPVSGNFIPYFVKTDVAGAPSYLFDSFLTPELWSAVVTMLIGVSSLVGAVILSARKQEEKCGPRMTLWLCVLAAVMLLLTAGYWLLVDRGVSLNIYLLLFCLGTLLVGFLLPLINIPFNTVLMRIIAKDKLSKVSSIINVLSQGLTPIAAVLAGVILQSFGSTFLLLICSVGFAATALFLLFKKEAREI